MDDPSNDGAEDRQDRGKGAVVMVDATVMRLLHERVPLTLLCDLLDPCGPRSAEIMAVERGELRPESLDGLDAVLPAPPAA